jgi:5,10-methylenetetrahydromethanopterin reductase
MTGIGVSLGVSPREDLRRFVELAKACERTGVETLWVIDSQLSMKDAYVAVTLGLWETRTLRIGTGVTNLVTRHPTVTANAMATLADVSGGRVMLGLGAGDSALRPLGIRPSRLADLDAGIQELRDLLGGTPTGDNGRAQISFRPADPVPIYLAASQPRMLELAGRLADGVIVMGPAAPDMVAAQIESVRRGARAAHRAGAVHVDVWVTLSVDADGRRGLDDVRSWASAQARLMAGWSQLPPSLEPFRNEMARAAAAYRFGEHLSVRAGHAAAVSDELTSVLAVAGSFDECRARLSGLAALGPSRITLTLLSGGRERRLREIEALCEGLPRTTRGPDPNAAGEHRSRPDSRSRRSPSDGD